MVPTLPAESPSLKTSLFSLVVVFIAWWFKDVIKPYSRFLYHCFLRPLGVGLDDQKSALYQFYKGQAKYYDATRRGLLQGRETMLNLCAAHLRTSCQNEKLVWVDIGGGTGYNIEVMDKFFPIANFEAVYLIDLCEPLLDVARERFAKKGWDNVHVLCQDASIFTLPTWPNGTLKKGSINLATLSYSLSMIPEYHRVIDRVEGALSPNKGFLGVVDFYTAPRGGSVHQRAIGGAGKQCSWLSRWFWQMWFELDHIHVGPERRSYLEYKFGTVKNYNDRNAFLIPFLVRIPFYIWLGRPLTCDVTGPLEKFDIANDHALVRRISHSEEKPHPLGSNYYALGKPLRQPFYEQGVHSDFRTYIYSFTWEDPAVDMEHLNLTPDDSMLVITSAGDNALHYVLHGKPQTIHCVDMNPSQNHLLELKLACLQSPSVTHDTFFSMFGSGKYPSFVRLLDTDLSPYLSSSAYAFWRQKNRSAFSKGFYTQGYTGLALHICQALLYVFGRSQDVKRFCESETLEEQIKIWDTRLRPILLNPWMLGKLAESGVVCWNTLGVPKNQLDMVQAAGSCAEFIRDTFDPLVRKWTMKENYFYFLVLLGHYTRRTCPSYLTEEGFSTLRADHGKELDSLRLHTDSISNVLKKLQPDSLTKAVIMDHLDWFTPSIDNPDVVEEVSLFFSRMKNGGQVFWRSASQDPWYAKVFENEGFTVERISVRESGMAIDRVNMYASFWKATKV